MEAAELIDPWCLWLILGGLLLAAEMIGTNGYLLWSGIAAVVTSIISAIFPASWELQLLSFALLTMLAAYSWYRWLKRRTATQPFALNQRGQQLIGRRLLLDEALVNGFGHTRVGDGSWRVQANEDLPAGCEIIITGIEGNTLQIKRSDHSSS